MKKYKTLTSKPVYHLRLASDVCRQRLSSKRRKKKIWIYKHGTYKLNHDKSAKTHKCTRT